MAFISQPGAGGGIPAGTVRPRNPYPRVPAPRPTPPPMPGAGIAPPTFNMPPPIDSSSFGAQAAAEAQRQIDPILQLITQRANNQAIYSQNAITALTDAYANRLSGLAGDATAAYGSGISQSKAFTGAADKQLTKAGKGAAKTEAGATGLGGVSAGSDVNLAAEGAGAGDAAGAIQEGMTQALKTAQGAAAKYAGALPGFAQAGGRMNITQVLRDLSMRMADQLAETTAQAPALYHQLYNELQDRAENDRNFKLEMAKLQYQIDSDTYDRRTAAAQTRASITGPRAPTNAGRQAYWEKVAADRQANDPLGRMWQGTTTGIRPVSAQGRVLHTAAWTDRQAKVIAATYTNPDGTISATGRAKLKALGIDAGGGMDPTTATKYGIQAIKSADAARKLQATQDAQAARLAETIAHNRQIEANTRASTAQRAAAAKARLEAARRARLITMAKNRTQATGNIWVAGPNGIHVLHTPDGKPVPAATKTTTSVTTRSGGSSTTRTTTAPTGALPPPTAPGGETTRYNKTKGRWEHKNARGVWVAGRA